jgi:hypothetical protein
MTDEPTFTIKIQSCNFPHLTMEQLTEKLKLMSKMGFTKYYTIIEDEKPSEETSK